MPLEYIITNNRTNTKYFSLDLDAIEINLNLYNYDIYIKKINLNVTNSFLKISSVSLPHLILSFLIALFI